MSEYFVIPVVVILVVIVYFVVRNIVKINAEKYVPYYNVSYFISVGLIALFWVGSNGLTWRINTEVWSHFGSFLGAFLLAATLLFQIRSFRRQQVEAKFFEMVKFYRENISEMRFRNPFHYKDGKREYEEEFVDGRRVMKLIFDQYRVAYGISQKINLFNHDILDQKVVSMRYKNHLEKISDDTAKKRLIMNEIAYLITFWGVSRGSFLELEERLIKQFDFKKNSLGNSNDDLKQPRTDLIKQVLKIIAVYECDEDREKYSSLINNHLRLKPKRGKIECTCSDGKTKFFGGHQYQLGHYYRHLFQTVKFIDNQPAWLFSQDEKYDYVKTLRAQMSNYEQALLFINSLTIMGRNWEYSNKDGKSLITTYKLIKNLPKMFVPEMNPKEYYSNMVFEWEDDDELDQEDNPNKKEKGPVSLNEISLVKQDNQKHKNKYCKNFIKVLSKVYHSQFIRFFTQDEEKDDSEIPKNETWPVILVKCIKNIAQYAIGFGLFILVLSKMENTIGISIWPDFEWSKALFVKYQSVGILKIVSYGLGAATAVELAYMLFTPGPDEAVQPVMTGIAAFILYALSTDPITLSGTKIIGIALMVLTIPLLFWTKRQWIDDKESSKVSQQVNFTFIKRGR